MNDIQLARLASDLREDINAAAQSALRLGDIETWATLAQYSKGKVVR